MYYLPRSAGQKKTGVAQRKRHPSFFGIIIIALIGYGIEMLIPRVPGFDPFDGGKPGNLGIMRLAERYLIPWKGRR